jgi:hypothetical protein
MKLPDEIARPSKFTHAETILYEIDMVRFAAGSFGEADGLSSWRNLECFLIHFRNLIEFFGKEPTRDNLSIQRPETVWPDEATRPSAEELRQLFRDDLWDKYEVREPNDVNDKISRYLQHCTEQRVNGKNWRVREMFEELDRVMSEFEKLLPDRSRPWANFLKSDRGIVTVSVATCTTASPPEVRSQVLNSTPLKKSD